MAAVVRALEPGARCPARGCAAVAYTAMHGVGADTTRAVFAAAGLAEPVSVPEQDRPDPAFPTVAFPNPEEPGATDLLKALAERIGADVGDRRGPGRRPLRGGLRRPAADRRRGGRAAGRLAAAPRGARARTRRSLVSGSLLHVLAGAHGVPSAETPTGFKWIMRAGSAEAPLVFGYEEALGYAVAPVGGARQGRHLRRAGRRAAGRGAEGRRAARCSTGSTSWPREHGLFATGQLSVRVEDLIADLRRDGRGCARDPPARLLGRRGRRSPTWRSRSRRSTRVRLLGDGVRVIVRPSGTEPKLKAYLETVVPVHDDAGLHRRPRPRRGRARPAARGDVRRPRTGLSGGDRPGAGVRRVRHGGRLALGRRP